MLAKPPQPWRCEPGACAGLPSPSRAVILRGGSLLPSLGQVRRDSSSTSIATCVESPRGVRVGQSTFPAAQSAQDKLSGATLQLFDREIGVIDVEAFGPFLSRLSPSAGLFLSQDLSSHVHWIHEMVIISLLRAQSIAEAGAAAQGVFGMYVEPLAACENSSAIQWIQRSRLQKTQRGRAPCMRSTLPATLYGVPACACPAAARGSGKINDVQKRQGCSIATLEDVRAFRRSGTKLHPDEMSRSLVRESIVGVSRRLEGASHAYITSQA